MYIYSICMYWYIHVQHKQICVIDGDEHEEYRGSHSDYLCFCEKDLLQIEHLNGFILV